MVIKSQLRYSSLMSVTWVTFRERCHASDCAKADDAQLLSLQLRPRELFFLFFNLLDNIRIIPVGADPVHALHNIPRCKQHTGNDKLLYPVCIGTGRIEDNDAPAGAPVQRNVIDAGACPCNGEKII